MSAMMLPSTTTILPQSISQIRTTSLRPVFTDDLDSTTNLRPSSELSPVLRPVTDTAGTAGQTGGLNGGGSLQDLLNGMTQGTRPIDGLNRPSTNDLLFYKIDELQLLGGNPNDQSKIFDPTLAIYQNILDTEKCTERIACRIAVTEKVGVMPHWVNW